MTVTALPEAALRPSDQFAVDLEAVGKRFGGVTAVDGISLRIRPGEVVALLGPNGAGKTTTVDMLLGLSAPSSGTARVYGRPPREAVSLGLVSAVMQTGGLLKDYTVEETVRLTAVLFGRGRGVVAGSGVADPGRADDGDGCRGAARLLDLDPGGRAFRPYRHFRHPLPGGGGCVRGSGGLRA